MATSWSSCCWQLGLASFVAMGGAMANSRNCVLAQITSDSTLGAESSVVTPNIDINGLPSDRIDGGAIRGANLFHSFLEFNIGEGRGVYFTNPAGIQNILSRVTGGNPSRILGKLGVLGNANLFLINPNGIIFGPNAQLDVGGSFVGSTASSLNFADGNQFSATAPQTTSLLTVNVPLGLQYGVNPGRILVQGDSQGTRTTTDLIDTTVGLRVSPNQTLALIGGDVALEGGTLKTAGGQIKLGSVASSGLVNLSPTEKGFSLSYEGVPTFGNIQLSQQATADASGVGGGDIQVRGKQVTLTNGSQIESSTLGSEPGGTVSVKASDSVELIGTSVDGQFTSGLFSSAYLGATGAGGSLTIDTGRLTVRDGAQIIASTFDEEAGGTLAVRAAKSVELIGTSVDGQFTSGLITSVYPGARGAGGSLTIDTGRLTVRDGAQIIAGTFGQRSGGNLTVTASESVELMGTSPDGQDSSGLYTQSDYFETADNTGSGGELTITTRRLIVEDGAVVSASTFTQGSGGNLSVTALESVELMGTSPDRQVSSGLYTQTQGAGAAGNLTVETEQLTVQDGARVSVSSESSGNAGNLLLTARSIRLDDGGKITATSILGKGGGNINLQDMNLLLLRDNSEISTNAGGTGNGGNINIDTDLLAVFENSNITARAVEGRGGNIRITTQGLFLSPNSKITATSERGIDGVVEINRPDIDPNAELVVLPAQLVDVSGLIAQGCSALGSNVANGESKFVVTGRGGLPPTSREAFNSDAVLEDWGTPALATTQPQRDRKSDRPNHIVSNNATHPTPTPLVEAQGWVIGDNGEVVLTASASNVTSHSSWLTPAACHGN